MSNFVRFCLLSLAIGMPLGAVAQVGSVAGTITAGDTQRPMRFAKVTLTPVKNDTPDLKGITEKSAKDDPAVAMKAMSSLMGSITMLQGQTGLDGTYAIAGVAPGDYYLMATSPGYVSAAAVGVSDAGAGASTKQMMAGVPVVHVEANRAARGDATLTRGAAITGTVLFDDGSPVTGALVQFEDYEKAMAKAAKKASGADDDDMSAFGPAMSMAMSGGLTLSSTDDRGKFRMAGLATGDYLVKVTLTLSSGVSMKNGVMDMSSALHASPLLFFAPGTLHVKDAQKIVAHAGEERSDILVTVDLSAMKTVRGRVSSAVDHHALNAGTVTLTDTSDKALTRSGAVDADGNFLVSYVPAGTWALEVSGGADTEAAKKKPGGGLLRFDTPHTVRSYEDGGTTVIVAASDVAGVNVELKESKTVKKEMDMEEMMKMLAAPPPPPPPPATPR